MRTARTNTYLSPLIKSGVRSLILRLASAVFVSLILGLSTMAGAQELQLGIDFSTVIPKGDFKQNIENNGYGVGVQAAYRVRSWPVLFGVDAGFVNYGSEKHREPISPTIPELQLTVQTDNNIVWTHLLIRAQPKQGRVRPYLDGLVGFKRLSTQTEIKDENSDNVLASTTNLSDTTLSYGLGGGVQVRLAGMGRGREILLDGKARYLRGGDAKYLKKGSIIRENGNVFFDVLSSRTDVVTVQVGITFKF